MKRLLIAAAFFISFVPLARAAEEENPFKKANVGDWVEYKLATSAANINVTGQLKITVTAKTDTKASIKTSAKINGQEVATQAVEVDLSKPLDPTAISGIPGGAQVKLDGNGKAELTLAGKKYECATTKFKFNAPVGGQDVESDVTVWMNKDIPLTGMAKMELKSKNGDMVLEFAGSGNTPPPAK
jgi:hypothetical protein